MSPSGHVLGGVPVDSNWQADGVAVHSLASAEAVVAVADCCCSVLSVAACQWGAPGLKAVALLV